MRRVACSITVRTWAWVPSSRSVVKKSHARIASAWERRNCDQVGPVRRGAGPMPLALRISHTVDAATLAPRPASSPWILRYPHSGFSLASRMTRALMFRPGGRAAGPAALGSSGPAAADDVAVPAQDRVPRYLGPESWILTSPQASPSRTRLSKKQRRGAAGPAAPCTSARPLRGQAAGGE